MPNIIKGVPDPSHGDDLAAIAQAIQQAFHLLSQGLDRFAAGERNSARRLYLEGETQYSAALHLLLSSEALTLAQRDEVHSELGNLIEVLAGLHAQIFMSGFGLTVTHRGAETFPIVDFGGIMNSAEVYRKEMMAAGQRLLDALQVEQKFGRLYLADPVDGPLEQWQNSRELVEHNQKDYDDSIRRYREAIVRSPPEPEPPLSRKTILVLEDEHLVASLLRTLLERKGARVLQASTGDQAVALCEYQKGNINLLIADVILGGGPQGLETAHRLAELRPEIPVLFISGFPESQLVNRGLLQPDSHVFRNASFLQKPFSPAALDAQIRKLID